MKLSTFDGMAIGFIAGLATAMLGAYKDTTYEGFDSNTFWRSPIIASLYGVLGVHVFPENESKILLATFSSTCERITVESWKATTKKMPGKFKWGPEHDRSWLEKKGAVATAR